MITRRVALPILGVILFAGALVAADSLPGRFFRFERLTPRAGTVPVVGFSSVCQDREGFLWLGTSAGLARYDGYRFSLLAPTADGPGSSSPVAVFPVTITRSGRIWIGTSGYGLFEFSKETGSSVRYRHDPTDSRSLSDDIVLAVQEGPDGDLWIGTRSHGLCRFNPASRIFTGVTQVPGTEVVWDVLADRTGAIWAGTLESGLFRIDPKTGVAANFRFVPDDPRSLGSDNVWTIFEDREGTIWAGTKGGGLNRFDPASGHFSRFYGAGDFPRDLAKQTITAIAEDRTGRLWLGTASEGLRIWDRGSGDYVVCRNDPQDPESLGDDSVTSIFEDAGGVVWVGTVRGGLNKCLSGLVKFEHYKHSPTNPRSLAHNDVRALWADGQGILWVGLKHGVERLDAKTGRTRRYLQDAPAEDRPNETAVLAVLGDFRGGIWLGTETRGLARLDPATGQISYRRRDPRDPNSLSNDKVNVLREDPTRPDVLWVGTHQGLNRYETGTNRWTRFLNDPRDESSLSGNIITAIHESGSGGLWIGTRWGLNRLDRATGKCVRYVSHLGDPAGANIKGNIINCILEGRDGILWVGTDDGLNRFNRAEGMWKAFSQRDGLAGEVVCGVLEDAAGALWVSTNRGLSRLDPRTEVFTNFGLHDGLQGRDYHPGAAFLEPDGRMSFGGINGFNRFSPEAVKKDPFVPPVAWTAFKRNNREVDLPQPLSALRKLTLPYKTPLAAFEFAALSFAAPDMNELVYRLEPRDSGWIPLDPDNSVSLFGLGAGSYTLRVKAANPDGVWNEEGIAIAIEVSPPLWRTWWFLLFAAASLAAGAGSLAALLRKAKSSALSLGEDLDAAIGSFDLTSRELEVLRLVLRGSGNKDIGRKLFISASTVRNHIHNIYRKLGVRNRLELISRISKDARERP